MEEPAILVNHVTKIFKLPLEKSDSLKSTIVNFYRTKRGYEMQRALNNVSLEVGNGDFFGIVGRNGSGKSTLLKILAGIYSPTQGSVVVNGSLTPFIELGVGFNPELTGRENVFLNGALLGFNRKEMRVMYKDIVEFAELERFMDQRLKNYSSGMQVRLAFSIAIRAKSDILLIDEVLAVGDEEFQKKCFSIFENYKANKKTIVLVTHDMSVVERFCNRAILLDKGKILEAGEPRKVAHQYSRMNTDRYIDYKSREQGKSLEDQIIEKWGMSFKVLSPAGKASYTFYHGDSVTLNMKWDKPGVKNVGIALVKQSGEYVFGSNTIIDKFKLKGKQVEYKITLNLGQGDYGFKIGLFGDSDKDVLEFIDGPSIFMDQPENAEWGGITKLDHSWG